ncbi:MAG: pentapeptide repeat-containing protein [Candidatus Babeliales bacterium]|jgi:uncharacterized protein YjbI with pentapeptide repeats
MKTVLRRCVVNVLLLGSLGCNLAAMNPEEEKTPFLPEQFFQDSSGSSSSPHPRPPVQSSFTSSSLSSSSSPHHSLSHAYEDFDAEEDMRTRARRMAAQAAHRAHEAEEEKKMPPQAIQPVHAPAQGNLRVLNQAEFEQILAGNKDFSNTDLRALDLRGRDLSNANLTGAVICGVGKDRLKDLTEIQLCGANLTNANFEFTNLVNADLEKAIIVHTNFAQSIIHGCRFKDSSISHETTFRDAEIKGILFQSITFNNVDFTDASIENVKFFQSNIENIDMSCIKAKNFFFVECEKLININFTKATIIGLMIYGTATIGPRINFTEATLEEGCIIGKIRHDGEPRTAGITEAGKAVSKLAYVGGTAAVIGIAALTWYVGGPVALGKIILGAGKKIAVKAALTVAKAKSPALATLLLAGKSFEKSAHNYAQEGNLPMTLAALNAANKIDALSQPLFKHVCLRELATGNHPVSRGRRALVLASIPRIAVEESAKIYNAIMEHRQIFGENNINTIIIGGNFHHATLRRIHICDAKLSNSINLENLSTAEGSILINVASSHAEHLERFRQSAAKVNGHWQKEIEKRNEADRPDARDPNLSSMVEILLERALGSFILGVVGL